MFKYINAAVNFAQATRKHPRCVHTNTQELVPINFIYKRKKK